ncbi:MAG: porin [Burkholderiales bacterium]|nr:porin [Burkholderiales bacterium]
MKKNLMALAVAGALVAPALAFAQASSVQIYGAMDAGFQYVDAPGATGVNQYQARTRIASNSSLIGFRGSENLGGGLRAIWQLENQLSIDGVGGNNTQTMANGWNTRTTFVGLTGGFGQVLVGYLNPPRRAYAVRNALVPGGTGPLAVVNYAGRINLGAAFAPLNAAANTTANTFGTTNGLANLSSITSRTQGVSYKTPTFDGFDAEIMYTPNESAGNVALSATQAKLDPSLWNLGLNYARGPFNMQFSYARLNDWTTQSLTSANLTALGITGRERTDAWMLGGGYAFGATTVAALFERVDVGLGQQPGLGALNIKRDLWMLRGRHTAGPHNVVLSYTRLGDNSVDGRALAAGFTYGESGADVYALRYGYNFSRRTEVNFVYSDTRNKKNGNYQTAGVSSMFPGGTGGGAGVINAGADPRIIGIGLRHTF